MPKSDERGNLGTTMKTIFHWVMSRCLPGLSFAAENKFPGTLVRRISVLASGEILLDGKTASIAHVKRALEKMKAKTSMVWYYRESGRGEPPEQAIELFKLIVENKLPISLSTKPDFSDYVDENGISLPRK